MDEVKGTEQTGEEDVDRRSATFPLTTVSSSGRATVGRRALAWLMWPLLLPAHAGVEEEAVTEMAVNEAEADENTKGC